jgi:hypothetical protein
MKAILLAAFGVIAGIASWLSDQDFSDSDFLDSSVEDRT